MENTRSHETNVVIDAQIEEVWKALTEAAAISRWFSPKATVEPGPGGYIIADWGPSLEWKTDIEIWQPPHHLRLTETRERVMSSSPVEETLEPCRLVQDYYLETSQGKTELRLVHSGFGSSEAWDKEYEGTRGGWAACFLRLKRMLELHKTDSVHNLILTAECPGVEYREVLDRIEAAIGEPFEAERRGKFEIAGILPERNGSILNVSAQPCVIGSMVYLELLLFGMSDSDVGALRTEWRSKLKSLFPEAVAKSNS